MAFPVVSEQQFPRMAVIQQRFASCAAVDIEGGVDAGMAAVSIRPGERIAVAAGSRGITDIGRTVRAVVAALRRHGAQPFIIPAMGSHGGATPEGQSALLAGYGITAENCAAPIDATLDTRCIGKTTDGIPVHIAQSALDADGVVVVNRIKPHTDFGGPYGSGILKMLSIGLGQCTGAGVLHRAAARLGLEHVIVEVGRFVLANTNMRAGVAMIENARHQLTHVEVIPSGQIYERERHLLAEARDAMARLPCDEIDLLIVDRLGKDISGTGMDPNVIGRMVHGYSSALPHLATSRPLIRRIFVRDLTEATHGNASGIGMADFTTTRVRNAFDAEKSMINALTSLSIQSVKMPIAFDNDHLAIGAALGSLALADPRGARVVRIRDTLNLHTVEMSEPCLLPTPTGTPLDVVAPARPMRFDASRNLLPIGI